MENHIVMQYLEGPYRVYIGLVPTGYLNADVIAQTVRDGIIYCGVAQKLEAVNELRFPRRVLVKPNLVLADAKIARHAYTHPEIVRAAISQVFSWAPRAFVNLLADRSPFPIAIERTLSRAHGNSEKFRVKGYYEFEHLFAGKVKISPVETSKLVRYQLAKGDTLASHDLAPKSKEHDQYRIFNEVFTSELFAQSDFNIYCPKIKTDVLSGGFSGALRLGWTGNGPLNDHRICDMLEICNPQLIISDGIVAAVGGNQATERGHELGVILVSNNAVAHDWIAAQVLSLDPSKIAHLNMAIERGWGPRSAAQIEIGGAGMDGIRHLCQKSKFWDTSVLPVQSFSEKFARENPGLELPFEILSEDQSSDHSALLDWLYMNYDFVPRRWKMSKWPKTSICVGPIRAYPTHGIVFGIGNAALKALDQLTSSSRVYFTIRDVSLTSVQFKNGKRHWLIRVPNEKPSPLTVTTLRAASEMPPNSMRLMLAFFIGSFGRISTPLLFPALLRWPLKVKRLFQTRQNRPPIMLTSRMPQNSWWALRKADKGLGSVDVSEQNFIGL